MNFTWNLITLKMTVAFTRSESVTGPVASCCPTETSLRSREFPLKFVSSVVGLSVGIYKEKQRKAVVQSCNENFFLLKKLKTNLNFT